MSVLVNYTSVQRSTAGSAVTTMDPQIPTYLVGFAESVPTPEVCFSLRTTGNRIVCFCRQLIYKSFVQLPFVEYHQVTAPECNLEGTVAEIGALIARLRPEMIIPCDDTALLVTARLRSGYGGPALLAEQAGKMPLGEACAFALDKWAQIEAARGCGFAVIPTQLVKSEADIARFPIRPAMLKPRAAVNISGTRTKKGRAFVLSDFSVLTPEVRAAVSKEHYLIQEYKPGVGEGFFGIAHSGNIYAGFGHRRLRMMNPQGSGSSACVSRTPEFEEFRAARSLIRRVDWRGPFMVEMLRDRAGKLWFMEFNGRFWGSLALARRCGFDMPRIASDLAYGRSPSIPSNVTPACAQHLGRDIVHLLFVLRELRRTVTAREWSAGISTLVKILQPNRLSSYYNYDPYYPSFFLKDAVVTVRNAVLRRRFA